MEDHSQYFHTVLASIPCVARVDLLNVIETGTDKMVPREILAEDRRECNSFSLGVWRVTVSLLKRERVRKLNRQVDHPWGLSLLRQYS